MKIAQVGTFDLDNLGDLLFPWVTKQIFKLLYGQQICYDCFSPMHADLMYPDQVPSRAISMIDAEGLGENYDLILIGGGDLIRDDDYSLYPVYGTGSPGLTFCQILSPTSSTKARMALLAVGLPYDISEDFGYFLKNSFSRLQHVAVRDERSASYLSAYVSQPINIIPDFVHAIAHFLPRKKCSDLVTSLIGVSEDNYFCFQGHRDVCGSVQVAAGFLKKIEAALGKPFILVEIGGCLGDTEYLGELASLTGYRFVSKENFPDISLEEKVAIIACSSGFIGSSLHGNILSNTYGIPNVSYVGNFSHKISNYFKGGDSGLLFDDFECLVAALDEVISCLSEFKLKNLSANEVRCDAIFSFIRGLVLPQLNESAVNSYIPEIDKIYKLGHQKSCIREGIVRQQLENKELALFAEKENAAAQIKYRDKYIEELKQMLQAEKDNAFQQITYRDTLIDELNNKVKKKR